MKHLKLFENFEEEEVITKPTKGEEYPSSVRTIFNRYSKSQQQSIESDMPRFARVAKKLYYLKNKSWKLYFSDKSYKSLTSLNDIIDSIEKWMSNQ